MRNVEYICTEEIQAVRETLGNSCDPVEIARHLGIARLSTNARKRIEEVIRRN